MHPEQLSGIRFHKSPTFARQAMGLSAWEQVDALKHRLAEHMCELMQRQLGLLE